ncbi:receptor-type tyrosine-protein phosphatase beta-like [Ruditapes philippinarum]|uniref:receptor-type tyrosine-protein phosphatase beta-like n=1 Tax=Ruditapes philippinarum TaxID=129788 RepID=UPI00295A6E8F|nr:receptor-type tyrosine-protein phosphatase beta-like [Ruditapes philippinarum]
MKIGYTVPNPDPYRLINRVFEKNITMLKPESEYDVMIYAISSNNHEGQENTLTIRTDVCAPPDWTPSDLNAVTMQSSSTSYVTIQLPNAFFSKTEQGKLQEIGFIVLPRESIYFDGFPPINLEKHQMIGTIPKNNEFTKEFRVEVTTEGITNGMLKIGSDCTSNSDFCNGPLPEQFSFKVAAYACTRKTLCRVARPIGPYVTKAKQIDNGSSPSGLVIGLSVVMVLLAACAAFTFLWYKDYIHPGSWFSRKNNDDNDDSFTSLDRIVKNRPIKVCNYVRELDEMHKDTNLLLSDQYDDINKLGQIIAENSTTHAARHENNTPKNRWVNILPFDHSRVKLQQLDEDDPTTDYINANYMPGFHNQREYIATQGPLPGTIDDFWRMVWEHGVMVIVMLTQCKEGNRWNMEGQVKCEKYWPDELREPKQYGDVVVNPTSISQLDKYNISIFDVSVNDETRQVIHFHYLDFPDFSANVEFDHFINFVRTVRSHVPHDMKGPMVIHCSAGVGRTGTFIATDRLHLYLSSDQFSEEDEVDIFGIVLSLRENRVAMVQTESQFIMIHDCFEKMLEEKRAALKMTDSGENLYENQGFDQTHPGSHPFPETLYENVSSQEQTEL